MVRLVLALCCLAAFAAAAAPQHRLEVALDPAEHRIEASDRLRLTGPVDFLLHDGLTVNVEGGALERGTRVDGPVPLRRWRLMPHGEAVTLRWRGVIHHPVRAFGDRLRGQAATPGTLGPEGVYLDGGSGWYPLIEGWPRFTFELRLRLPSGWQVVSQGRRSGGGREVRWRAEAPQEDVVLVGGPLRRWSQRGPGGIALAVYLHDDEPELARTYLTAGARHLAFYQDLLGPYPYPKFAVVENFWESGYGFPSFTLLGPRVLRLPFIPHTSLPHEILHNWWGNGVYVDWGRGNWSEGLTAYLSDHLMKERRGQGAAYRRATLQKYRAYAADGRDFPLRAFRARHSGASEAVGYGKALMVLHMLRERLGDAPFLQALRDFYRAHRFQVAAWADLRAAFETAGTVDLGPFFDQWLERPGAPHLLPRAARWADGRLRLTLAQVQDGPAYRLQVPVALTLDGHAQAWETRLAMTAKEQTFEIEAPGRPLRVDVDPRFDLFRYLDDSEIPPALGAFFGARERLLVLPARAPAPMRRAYRALAEAWEEPGVAQRVVLDRDLERLPDDRPVWILGRDNRFLADIARSLPALGARLDETGLHLDGRDLPWTGHCLVLAAPGPAATAPRLFAACDDPAAATPLARKLPHYGRYGVLAFVGARAGNVFKGEWTLRDTVMTVRLPGGETAPRATLVPRAPLAR